MIYKGVFSLLPLISIIVPVYNKKEYIKSCIDSLLKQTYKNIEIILVNDGSTDGSNIICDEYSGYCNIVHIYHKNNAGVSSARNFGIVKAKGEYICFIDADDIVANNYVERLYEELCRENTDIVICSVREIHYENSKKIKVVNKVLKKQKGKILNDLEKLYYNKNFYMGGVYLKIYKTDVIKSNNLKFREDLSFGEDYIFNLEYFELIETYCTISDILYTYNIYPKAGNAEERLNDLRIENEQKILKITQEYINKNKVYLSSKILLSETLRIIDVFLSIIIEDKNLNYFNKYRLFVLTMKKFDIKNLITHSIFTNGLPLKGKFALWVLKNNCYLILIIKKYLR